MSTLYITATPIGNLGDITVRALETLRSCDFVAAEDTRVTLRLLNHFDIKKPLVSYHEHSSRETAERIAARISSGEVCVLVSDAGMPAISDPGRELVALCHSEGIPVRVIPGASAAVSAVAASGLDAARFCFEGFLSATARVRRERLAELRGETRAMVFYEAPHKLARTLRDLADAFGEERRVSVSRELTKLHEETFVTTLGEAAAMYADGSARGEFALVVEGAPEGSSDTRDPEGAVREAKRLAEEEGLSTSEAAKRAAAMFGVPKGEIYRALLWDRPEDR